MPDPRVTVQDVADAAGVSAATVRRWARAGLLPAPTVYYGLKPGKHSFWPEQAPAQARWVAAQLGAGRSFSQVKDALEAGEFPGA
ncbi:MAG: MerR family DNA-binding transcriptional regulator [Myxococcales bacterium]|nr:MerR family DNA-binding transcriptional regulator [Myxococcales bacterium]